MVEKKVDWNVLNDKYCKEENVNDKIVWDGVSELYSDSAEKLLSTPELVKEYISKWGVSDNIKKIIKKNSD